MDVCRGDPPDTGESGRHWRVSAETLFRWTSRASLKCHRGPRCDAIGAARVVVSDWPAHGVRVVRCSSVGRGDLQAAAASYPRRPSGVRTPSTALPSPGGQGGTGRGGMAETVRPSKPLDVSGASRDAWLIKVPHQLGKKLQAVCERSAQGHRAQGDLIGAVIVQEGQNKGPARAVLRFSGLDGVSEEWETVPDAGGPSLYVMTETDKGLGVSGRVAQKVMLRPRKRAADAASESAARPVAQRPKTEAAAPMLHMGSLDEGPTVTNTHIFAQRGWYERHKQAMAEAMEEKEQAQKLDRPALERAVFAAFTRQRFWKMVQLSSYLKQPVNEVLREVAVRHTVGPHAGEWELKPEFRAR